MFFTFVCNKTTNDNIIFVINWQQVLMNSKENEKRFLLCGKKSYLIANFSTETSDQKNHLNNEKISWINTLTERNLLQRFFVSHARGPKGHDIMW